MNKPRSLCKGKRTSNPNKCKNLRACKVASGKKRTFCRTKRNKTKSNKKVNQTKKRKTRLNEVSKLKGHNKKTQRALKNLK
jgi:hypothetical protein